MAKLNGRGEFWGENSAISALLLPDMQVFSLDEGAAMGRVKELIIDPDEKCLLAIAVDLGGWYHNVRVIPAGKIRTIGDDVVMIDEKQAAMVAPNLPKIVEQMKNPCSIIGARVISENGRNLGKIDDFYIERHSGAISQLELSGGVFGWLWAGKVGLAASHIVRLGEEAVVVDNSAMDDLSVKSGLLKVNFEALAGLAGQGAEAIGGRRAKVSRRLKEIAEQRRTRPEEAANM